jgi:hypothetical protein
MRRQGRAMGALLRPAVDDTRWNGPKSRDVDNPVCRARRTIRLVVDDC